MLEALYQLCHLSVMVLMVYTVELWVTIVVDKFRYETNEYNREDLGMRIESDSSLSLSLSLSLTLSLSLPHSLSFSLSLTLAPFLKPKTANHVLLQICTRALTCNLLLTTNTL